MRHHPVLREVPCLSAGRENGRLGMDSVLVCV